MELQTIGHGTLVLRDDRGDPLLITDPWILGSCYWRSWWLENEPTAAQIDELARARFCYLTHEHPDHFHPPSLRRIGTGPLYLVPTFLQSAMATYLREHGFRAHELAPRSWYRLDDGVAVLSVPCIGDDSMLIVDTPDAVIIDLNDARPTPLQIRHLRRLLDRDLRKKRRILLGSYSTAGIANSFFRDGGRVTLFDKAAFVRYVSWASRILAVDQFVPFASQVVYRRSDTRWANDYRVTYDDVRRHFRAPGTMLLPPYSRIDLRSGEYRASPPPSVRIDEPRAVAKAAEQEARERDCALDDDDIAKLERKLRAAGRWSLCAMFPRGIGFELGGTSLTYNTWMGRIRRGAAAGSFVMSAPAQAVRDVLATDHFSDLSIPMFTFIKLSRFTDPRVLYVFFLLMTLHDGGATRDFANFRRWLGATLATNFAPMPEPSTAQPL